MAAADSKGSAVIFHEICGGGLGGVGGLNLWRGLEWCTAVVVDDGLYNNVQAWYVIK